MNDQEKIEWNKALLLQIASMVDDQLHEMLLGVGGNIQLLSSLLVTRLKRLNADLDNDEEYDKLLKEVLKIKMKSPTAKQAMDDLSEAKSLLDKISIRSKQ